MTNWLKEQQKELNKHKMKYPQEFIDRCLELYPDNEEIKELLDTESFLLGSFLKNNIPSPVTDEEIVEASKVKNFTEVARKNKERIDKSELYNRFIDLYDEQYRSKGHFILNGLERSSGEVLLDYQIRHGIVKIEKFKVDRVAERQSQEALRLRLEQNAERRRVGEEIAKNMWCGGPGC